MGQQSHSATNTKLNRIAWLSTQDSWKKFECLMHLFNQDSLIGCFHELDKNKAVGIDGVTKMAYGADLHGNIEQLITKMKDMAYRPGPVKEVLIPKEGKLGATRQTRAKSMRTKLKRIGEWAKQIRNERPMKEIWQIFKAKLRGHIQYYGVSHNIEKVNTFLFMATGIVYKWLNRRSQRKSFNWEEFQLYKLADPLPTGKIVHKLF